MIGLMDENLGTIAIIGFYAFLCAGDATFQWRAVVFDSGYAVKIVLKMERNVLMLEINTKVSVHPINQTNITFCVQINKILLKHSYFKCVLNIADYLQK
jgi:hypothetical protein